MRCRRRSHFAATGEIVSIDPEHRRLFEEIETIANKRLVEGDVDTAIQGFRHAATVYAGCPDPEALEKRHCSLASVANLLRDSGKSDEAEIAYAQLVRALLEERGPRMDLYPWALERLGRLRFARKDYNGAAEALGTAATAYAHIAKLREAVIANAEYGRALLAAHRWKEAADVLTSVRARLSEIAANDRQAAPSALNNLAFVLVRSGRAEEAVAIGREAFELRAATDGADHPNTVDTLLVYARALADAGMLEAATKAARQAARVISRNAGESHTYFADALLVEARCLARSGDGVAAEALARRARYILQALYGELEPDNLRMLDMAEVRTLWRTGSGARGPRDLAVWEVSLQHTLRRYRAETLGFDGSGDKPRRWYFIVPAHWNASDPGTVTYAARIVFADINAALTAQEPADPNMLDATHVEARVLLREAIFSIDVADAFRARGWEPSVAWKIVDGRSASAMSPIEFATVAAALARLAGAGWSRSWLDPLGLDEAIVARLEADPGSVLG